MGIADFIEVKFYENRANGQSKGFCMVTVGSEQSLRNCLENLGKRPIYNMMPEVTYASKQALFAVSFDVRLVIVLFRSIIAVFRNVLIADFQFKKKLMKVKT